MNKSKTDNVKAFTKKDKNDSKDEAVEEKPRRRLQDSIESKNPVRQMNLDRRIKNNDRRSNYDPDYKGPSRRLTIDRRLKNQDRRKKDKDDDIIY